MHWPKCVEFRCERRDVAKRLELVLAAVDEVEPQLWIVCDQQRRMEREFHLLRSLVAKGLLLTAERSRHEVPWIRVALKDRESCRSDMVGKDRGIPDQRAKIVADDRDLPFFAAEICLR